MLLCVDATEPLLVGVVDPVDELGVSDPIELGALYP